MLFRESPRYLLTLIYHLPTNGAYYASRRGGAEFRGWDIDRYINVAQVNAQRAANHIQLMINRDPKRPAPPVPDSFPTPDRKQEEPQEIKPGSFAAIAASMMAAQKKKKEEAGA